MNLVGKVFIFSGQFITLDPVIFYYQDKADQELTSAVLDTDLYEHFGIDYSKSHPFCAEL